jgi:hypothetical protein
MNIHYGSAFGIGLAWNHHAIGTNEILVAAILMEPQGKTRDKFIDDFIRSVVNEIRALLINIQGNGFAIVPVLRETITRVFDIRGAGGSLLLCAHGISIVEHCPGSARYPVIKL